MILDGYFIAPDANDDVCIWRRSGEFPEPILNQRQLAEDPAVWEYLAAVIPEETP